jgi:hypothetical protein
MFKSGMIKQKCTSVVEKLIRMLEAANIENISIMES